LKVRQLNRKVAILSDKLGDSAKIETRFDFNCLTEPERRLFERVNAIVDKYAPASPPDDVIEKNAGLWHKGLEIFAMRAMDLFVNVMPASLCCDELEEWYFKVYLYNFWLDWTESIQKLREMPKEHRETLLRERREMGILDKVFRLPRNRPETTKETERKEATEQ
jgi:hypothetical protein